MNNTIRLFCFLLLLSSCFQNNRTSKIPPIDQTTEDNIKELWTEAKLKKQISYKVFRMAMVGYYHINGLRNRDNITIIDYSKPSTKERFFVIDLNNKKLKYKSLVAHGVNSGWSIPKDFSNVPDSKKSSLGFFITAETYNGKHGHSLKIDGLEKGINDNARKRYIVIHNANYVSKSFIKKNGRLGRSWGCPALPKKVSEEIIDFISNGQCLFIYGDSNEYQINSNYVESEQLYK